MKNFNRDSKPGGDKDFKKRGFGGGGFRGGNRGFGGGRDSGRPFMHQATCAKCGKACQVPFKPTGDRAVFCNDCFERKGNIGQGRPRDYDQRKPSFDDKRMFAAVCSRCGNKCEVPFRPVEGKSVFCKQCFDKGGASGGATSGGKGADPFKGQFETLNAKLDRILKALAPAVESTASAEAKEEKKSKNTGKAKAVKKAVMKKKK